MTGTRWLKKGWAGLVLAVASLRAPWLDAGTLHTLDLASMHRAADLIVLVENFRRGGKNGVGFGLVRKVFKGEYGLGDPIHVIPWGVDFGQVSGIPGGKLLPSFTAVFFLKRLASPRHWETVFSGVRIVVEDRVFSVRPAGSDTYRILPATPELLEDATPYDRERFQRDLVEAGDRVHAVREALLLRPTGDGLEQLRSVLHTELRRAFPAATRSDLIVELAVWLAGHGDLEELWELRTRVPRDSMGHDLDRLFAGICTYGFIEAGLDASPGSSRFDAMLAFLATASAWLRNDVKLRTLEHLIDRLSSFNERVGTQSQLQAIYETTAAVFEKTAEPLGEKLVLDLLRLTKMGGPLATYYLGPVLLGRRPWLASLHLAYGSPRVFALFHPQTTTRKSLEGRVRFRRLASGYAFQNPTIVFQRRSTDGQTLDHYAHAVGLPSSALEQGKSGEFTTGFSWDFKRRPLASGEWRMFLQLTWTDGDERKTWSTEPVKFRIRH